MEALWRAHSNKGDGRPGGEGRTDEKGEGLGDSEGQGGGGSGKGLSAEAEQALRSKGVREEQ